MTSDVVNPKSVTRSSAFVADTQYLTEFALIGKHDLPQVECAVVMLGHQKYDGRRFVLLFY